jgi:hypothetical protein
VGPILHLNDSPSLTWNRYNLQYILFWLNILILSGIWYINMEWGIHHLTFGKRGDVLQLNRNCFVMLDKNRIIVVVVSLNQTWGQLYSNVIDYITITLQFSWLHYITITSIFKCNRLNYNYFVNVIDYITDYIIMQWSH